MIIWSGWGILVPVIVIGTSLIMEIVTEAAFNDDSYYQSQSWPLALTLVVSGILVWFIGKSLNSKSERVVIDKQTGEELVLNASNHRLFFVKMEYWSPVLLAAAILVLVLQ